MGTAVKSQKAYRALLRKKRDELLASAKAKPEALSVDMRTPDEAEFAVRSIDQDLAVATADLHSRTLREIDGALRRFEQGTYGVCEQCGQEIQPNRLKAIPWTRYCLSCEEERSKN